MTIEQASKKTRENFSTLYKFGNNYRFQIYNKTMNAWMESTPLPWHQANQSRSRRMAELGRELMGLEPTIYIGGNWQQYLKP